MSGRVRDPKPVRGRDELGAVEQVGGGRSLNDMMQHHDQEHDERRVACGLSEARVISRRWRFFHRLTVRVGSDYIAPRRTDRSQDTCADDGQSPAERAETQHRYGSAKARP